MVHVHEAHKNETSISDNVNFEKNVAILSIMVGLQKSNNEKLKHICQSLSQLKTTNKSTIVSETKLKDFLPRNTDRFYRYTRQQESNCTNSVIWTVFKVN